MNEFYLGLSVGSVQTIIGHPFDTIKTNYQNNLKLKYSPLNLYKGVSYPLFSSAIVNGFLFYSNDNIYKYSKNNFVSGFFTGLLCSPLINIFETLKVKEQTNIEINFNKIKKYTSKGIIATIFRESIGTSLYFGLYYNLKEKKGPFLSGCFAGSISWILTYPFDVIKSRIQSGLCNSWYDAIKMGNFSKGLLVCVGRSFIVNGISFSTYEYLKDKG